jgi:dATP pyrophosphohydrolase
MTKKKSGNPPGQIPIRTSVVCAYIFKREANKAKFLILKRKCQYMYGLWQQVAGKIEQGETAIQAILREIKEETGLVPKTFYSADIVESFYEDTHDCIHMVPVFVAVVDTKSKVVLSDEHNHYKWVSAAQAKKMVSFYQQKTSIGIVEKEFARKKPPEQLRIK